MGKQKDYINFKMQYTDDSVYCERCHENLDEKTNFKEKYICPFLDDPYCDECINQLESKYPPYK